jgi:hypothetical protein
MTKGPSPEIAICDLFEDQVEPARKAGFTVEPLVSAEANASPAFRSRQSRLPAAGSI